MKPNVGNTDKIVRITLAIVIATIGVYFIPIAIGRWGLVAVVPLVTGLISFCPVYKFFGVNTCSAKSVQ